jgi:hypothetical protein
VAGVCFRLMTRVGISFVLGVHLEEHGTLTLSINDRAHLPTTPKRAPLYRMTGKDDPQFGPIFSSSNSLASSLFTLVPKHPSVCIIYLSRASKWMLIVIEIAKMRALTLASFIITACFIIDVAFARPMYDIDTTEPSLSVKRATTGKRESPIPATL